MNTADRQPQQPPTPDDWTDTKPESTTPPERILPIPEGVTPSATKMAMVCYAVGAAAKCWEHPERAGVFDLDRASQIVTELCVALGVEQQGDAAPESARAATLTPEQPVKAPGQGGDIFLTRGKPVEADWPNGDRSLGYVDEGGYQLVTGWVGNRTPLPWGDARIVRVLTEDKPAQEPALPRPIEPEDVRVGMVVERRKGEAAVRDRAEQIDGELITGTAGWPWLWIPGHADGGWTLWLIEDAPEPVDAPAPVDPDAEAVERMAKEVHDRNCADVGCRDWDGHGESTRKAWRDDARVVIRNLRAQGFDVTPRAEQ